MVECLIQSMGVRPRGIEKLSESNMSIGHSLASISATFKSVESGGACLFARETEPNTLVKNSRIPSADKELPVRLSLYHLGGAMSDNAKVGQKYLHLPGQNLRFGRPVYVTFLTPGMAV